MKKLKKLQLKKEVISQIDNEQMNLIKGGDFKTYEHECPTIQRTCITNCETLCTCYNFCVTPTPGPTPPPTLFMSVCYTCAPE